MLSSMTPKRADRETDAAQAKRRSDILDRAAELFVRYGFRKTSMDDVARAADMSRQGVYFHYPTKEALFEATLGRLVERALLSCRAALSDEKLELHDRLLNAFVAMLGSSDLDATSELLEAAQARSMNTVINVDVEIIAELAKAIASSPATAAWLDRGVSPHDLGQLLMNTSYGLKYQRVSYEEYIAQMQKTISTICLLAAKRKGSHK
jgi:AcrR family transcriptional regulator